MTSAETGRDQSKRLGKAKPSSVTMSGVIVRGTCDPKPNCKRCFGRGYIGRDTETGSFILCKCAFRKKDKKDSAAPAAPPAPPTVEKESSCE